MTSAFSWHNSISLCPAFILYSKAKFSCYSRCFLTSYFFIPVPYNEKDILLGCQFQKVLEVSIEHFNFSFFSITGQGIDLDYRESLLLTMMAIPFLLRIKRLLISWLQLPSAAILEPRKIKSDTSCCHSQVFRVGLMIALSPEAAPGVIRQLKAVCWTRQGRGSRHHSKDVM